MGTGELLGKPDEMLGGYLRWTSIPSRRSSNTSSVASCYGNRDKLRQYWATRLVRLNFICVITEVLFCIDNHVV